MDANEHARQRVARYIELVAGADTAHATIANHVNAEVKTAHFAGPLIGRWRRGEVDISPGNLAAFARAYDRNPLEAFVAANLLELAEAAQGLDDDAMQMLAMVTEARVMRRPSSTATKRPRMRGNPGTAR